MLTMYEALSIGGHVMISRYREAHAITGRTSDSGLYVRTVCPYHIFLFAEILFYRFIYDDIVVLINTSAAIVSHTPCIAVDGFILRSTDHNQRSTISLGGYRHPLSCYVRLLPQAARDTSEAVRPIWPYNVLKRIHS